MAAHFEGSVGESSVQHCLSEGSSVTFRGVWRSRKERPRGASIGDAKKVSDIVVN